MKKRDLKLDRHRQKQRVAKNFIMPLLQMKVIETPTLLKIRRAEGT